MKHLLNCRKCDWHTVIEGESMLADYEIDVHEKSIRNRHDENACPKDSVAWVQL